MSNDKKNLDTRPLDPRQGDTPDTCYKCGTKGGRLNPVNYPSEVTCPKCGTTWDYRDPPPAQYKAY